MDLECSTAREVVEFFISIQKDKKGNTSRPLNAVFTKFERHDRSFFRSFTSDNRIKPQHQIEFEKLEQEYHEKYKKTYRIGYINKSTRKKIRGIISKATFIAFLRSDRAKDAKYYEAALWLDFSFNYLLGPNRERISFQEIADTCKELIMDKLPELPEYPDQISTEIYNKFDKAIPIFESKHTGETAAFLKKFYKFDKLPESYFVKKPDLPINPTDLPDNFKKIFPLTNRAQLVDVSRYTSELHDKFYFKGSLPDSYFNLPPPKKKLPSDYRELPSELSYLFPVLDTPEDLKKAAKTLREADYAFRRIPNDFIIHRKNLPPAHWFIENQETTLPITEQDEVAPFLLNLSKLYKFNLPLNTD